MPNYVIAYHGGTKFASPAEGAKHMTKWRAWMGGLGDAVVNPGAPFGKSKTVSSDGVSDGGGPNGLAGYSIMKADSMDAAVEMAKACPHLDIGTIEVAEAHDSSHVEDTIGRPHRLAVTKALTSVNPDHPELLAAYRAAWAIVGRSVICTEPNLNAGAPSS